MPLSSIVGLRDQKNIKIMVMQARHIVGGNVITMLLDLPSPVVSVHAFSHLRTDVRIRKCCSVDVWRVWGMYDDEKGAEMSVTAKDFSRSLGGSMQRCISEFRVELIDPMQLTD